MTPFISIIIPAKNEERFIGRCLSALAVVEYPRERYEVIVVDNGSSDNTMKIVEDFGFVTYSKPDITIAGLRNYGAEKAVGDVVAFLDADVVVTAKWLNNGVKALLEDGVGCAGCSPELPDKATWVERIWNMQVSLRPDKYDRDWIVSMNMFVWKKCFFEIGGFNVKLNTCEDVDFGYRMRKHYRIIYDKRIKAAHFGEAKTLTHLFKKESWRGISNFNGLTSHGIVWREVPSHAVALNYFILLTCMPILVFNVLGLPLILVATLMFAFPLYKALELSTKFKSYKYFFNLFIIWLVYGFARGWSVWRAITDSHDRN